MRKARTIRRLRTRMRRSMMLAVVVFVVAGAGDALAGATGGAWIDVPFVAQAKNGCGSASIAMVMMYWEKKDGRSTADGAADAEKIQEALYSRAEGGIPASAMKKYFEEAGYQAFAFRGDWEELGRHLGKGRPLIVALKASGAHGPLHYVVVAGTDAESGYVYVNDPAQGKMLRLSREGFESEWSGAHNWTLLAVPRRDS
jgi:ABC-type bacteriocin/lantibiotic exporter with double-glycine peptidase domain